MIVTKRVEAGLYIIEVISTIHHNNMFTVFKRGKRWHAQEFYTKVPVGIPFDTFRQAREYIESNCC